MDYVYDKQFACYNCSSDMKVRKVGYNKFVIECFNCGTHWYVDELGEFIFD